MFIPSTIFLNFQMKTLDTYEVFSYLYETMIMDNKNIKNIILSTGQVGLGVGSWPSNLTNAGSPPSEFDLLGELTQECRKNI